MLGEPTCSLTNRLTRAKCRQLVRFALWDPPLYSMEKTEISVDCVTSPYLIARQRLCILEEQACLALLHHGTTVH